MEAQNTGRKRYEAIDGLRAYSAIGIVLMHVRANGDYAVPGFVYGRLIPSFTNLVFLFMVVSSFGLCCGYYEKMTNGQISAAQFYRKRYARIWPYFAFMCLLDLCVSPSRDSLYEAFANMTLCFGLLPDAGNISVIGIGWFLGVLFVFYLVFPFFCFLVSSRRMAWFSFSVALAFNLLCSGYFGIDQTNIMYCAEFFLAGGLVFLYRDRLEGIARRYRWIVLTAILTAAAVYYFIGSYVWVLLALFSLLLIYSLGISGGTGGRVLKNRAVKFMSGISMEIYLCHMLVFRAMEKLGMVHLFPSDAFSYMAAAMGTAIGAAAFAKATQCGLSKFGAVLCSRMLKSAARY